MVWEKTDHLDSSCREDKAWQAITQGGEPSANITLLHGTHWLATVCHGTPLVSPMSSENMMCAGKKGINIKGLIDEPWHDDILTFVKMLATWPDLCARVWQIFIIIH